MSVNCTSVGFSVVTDGEKYISAGSNRLRTEFWGHLMIVVSFLALRYNYFPNVRNVPARIPVERLKQTDTSKYA